MFRLSASWQAQATSHAGCRSVRKQVPPELIPRQSQPRGFDIIYLLSTLLRWFPCGPLLASHLTRSSRAFSFCAHDHSLTATAAEGGLEPDPVSRLRRAFLHQISSYALSSLSRFVLMAHGDRRTGHSPFPVHLALRQRLPVIRFQGFAFDRECPRNQLRRRFVTTLLVQP